MPRYLIILLSLLLLVGLPGCAQSTEFTRLDESDTAVTDTPPTPAPTTPPPSGTTILADGQIVALNPVLTLSFETNGRLLTLTVQAGDTIQAGQIIATLDAAALQEAVANATLQVAQAENSLAQSQLSLDDLLNWEADETAVALAEANLAAAQTAYENAQTNDAAAGNSLTSARVNLDQAERQLTDAQKAYDTAYDPGREWELGMPGYKERLESERDGATRSLAFAQENLEVARAQYNLAVAGLNNETAVSANASVINAQQALHQATTGPTASEITAARLRVEQAEISLAQAQLSQQQAENALRKAELTAPWSGTVLSVPVALGAMITAGTPIITLLDSHHLQFHTTNLSERDLAQIHPGDPAELVLKAFPNNPLPGTVAGIAPQSSGTVGDAAVFTILINLETTDLTLRPGMTGRAEITHQNNDN